MHQCRRNAPHSRSGVFHSSHRHKTASLAKQGFVAGGAAAVTVAGRLGLAIRLRFHNHAPEQLAIGLTLYQQAADQVRCDDLGGAGEEGLGESWEVAYGFGSGLQQ